MSANQEALKKDVERLLNLKKKQEELGVLNQKDMQEKMELENKHKEFLQMNSQQMEQELKKKGSMKKVGVEGEDLKLIIEDYKRKYGEQSWYKEPEEQDGKVTLTFPSEEEVGIFFEGQARDNRSFIIVDNKTNEVIAYSNGDGNLYNGNGSVYEGGKFQSSNQRLSDFRMPEKEGARMGF
ncbi:type IV secretion protein Dot [Fluoribacter gormanii]|uniref:type IV secretion protein Dot n=1 Tax=Fluoribacter gormanii TaxID=464 RepID=UPI00224440FA|nr:type IV secretion protein Dot [Fluoribacter gormanii]MCW8444530.1 type IV secretion protein Dot [Fluoribacter gormanii]MCW8469722.1 type IV secretion protein Dot [Fluoribacter gormanii]